MEKGVDLLSFCDASGVFAEHYQSIGVISGTTESLCQMRNGLGEILDDLGMSEIKFSNINKLDSREFKAAQRFFTKSINNYIKSHSVRADVLTWYTADSRHSTPGRDDVENLGRMYYHLLRYIARKWNITSWSIYIDKNEQVDFNVLRECLNSRIAQIDIGQFPKIIESLEQIKELEAVKEISEVESCEEPLVQLADLFAGLARFSNEKGAECCEWLSIYGNPDQAPLIDFSSIESNLGEYSRSEVCRYYLIGEIYDLCKRYKLYVSLKEGKHLQTRNPSSPMNFWTYEPQGDYDKAPIR